jgi:SAM-dependent methyltransferase
MLDPRDCTVEETELGGDVIGVLAPVTIRHPRGTYALTPASSVFLRAISEHRELFYGRGLDWGCGTGGLGIVAAKIPAVNALVGLELSIEDLRAASENVELNGVTEKVTVLHADSYAALTSEGQELLSNVAGQVDFIVANPPASNGDDGFQFRRVIVAGAPSLLKERANVFLQISIQYGWARILGLAEEASGFTHEAVLASTPWVPFDLGRTDLRDQLDDYVAEEDRGGLTYTFGDPRTGGETNIDARAALELFRDFGVSPLTKWQVHMFSYERG